MKSEMGPEMPEMMVRAAKAAGFGAGLSRREFLYLSAGAVTSLAALNIGRVGGRMHPLSSSTTRKGSFWPTRAAVWAACIVNWPAPNSTTAVPSLPWPESRWAGTLTSVRRVHPAGFGCRAPGEAAGSLRKPAGSALTPFPAPRPVPRTPSSPTRLPAPASWIRLHALVAVCASEPVRGT